MPADRNLPVGQPFEHDPGVDDHLPVGRDGVDPLIVDLDLQARRGGPRQGGDQVDVTVLGGPHVVPAAVAVSGDSVIGG